MHIFWPYFGQNAKDSRYTTFWPKLRIPPANFARPLAGARPKVAVLQSLELKLFFPEKIRPFRDVSWLIQQKTSEK